MEQLLTSHFWLGLGTIIWVNIILSGDNAVVLRIILTIVAVKLLEFPYLKLAGGAALLWIAVQLLIPEEGGDEEVESSSHLLGAIKTILIADLVMSTDNVIAVAAVAKDSIALLVLGLVISIPLVIFSATILMKLMERYPIIITLGAAILGWTAGEMAVTDPAVAEWVNANTSWLHWGAPAVGAALVVVVGKWLAKRRLSIPENENI